MRTEELIALLALEPPQAPWRPWRIAAAAALALALCAAVWLAAMGPRPDLGDALAAPVTLAKTALPALASAMALIGALRLGRPEARRGHRLWPLGLALAVALGLLAASAWTTPAEGFSAAVRGQTLVKCLTAIPTLALLPLILSFGLLRRGASTAPVLSGALIGLACGAGAAAGYSLACTEDDPLFFVTWYGLAIALMSLAGAALGRHFLRW